MAAPNTNQAGAGSLKQSFSRLLFLPAGLSRVQPEGVCPGRAVAAFATLLLTVTGVASERMHAQETPAPVFAPPNAYPIERYESGWQKNPFVLKTAPVTTEKVSFARDWILAGCFGEADNPMVVLANTKTRERLRLKKGEPASNGMRLHSVTSSASRKDTVAEVSMGDATAILRFDDDSLKKTKGKPGAPAVAGSKASDGLAISPAAANDAPVASVPRDQGSGFPYSYENSDNKDRGSVASAGDPAAGDPSSGGGRKRMLTALKPVGGR